MQKMNIQMKPELKLNVTPTRSDFEKIEIIKPEKNILSKFERVMKPMNEMSLLHSKEIQKLSELKDLLLSKLATIEN